MTVCVDSSVALKWVLPEEDSEEAENLLLHWRSERQDIIAPAHFFAEISSVLRQRALRGGIDGLDVTEARAALLQLLTVGVVIRHSPDLHERAFDLAAELGQPTTYDTYYLALAETENCEYWTADAKFHRAARVRFPGVRWLPEAADPL